MVKISSIMTISAFAVLLIFGFGINKAFATIRPDISSAAKDHGRSDGAPDGIPRRCARGEGYHAEERKKRCSHRAFSGSWTTSSDAYRHFADGNVRHSSARLVSAVISI